MEKHKSQVKVAVASIGLVVLAIPSGALAWDGPSEPDQVVTMTVDLPATDGSDNGGSGCSGYSSINVSQSTLPATLDEVAPGIESPSYEQRVAYFDLALDDNFYDNSSDSYVDIFSLQEDGSYLISPTWSSRVDQWDAAALDTNSDGYLSTEDQSPLMLDRRVFATQPFDVTFDASTCLDSRNMGAVWAERTDVEAIVDDQGSQVWDSVEFNPEDEPNMVGFFQEFPTYNSTAYLLRPVRIADGLENIPLQVANCSFCGAPPILSGDSGTTSVRGIMTMYGDDQAGQYRVKFGFWLEVDSYGYFYDNYPFWFLPF